ncbi:MAG: LysR family transcriptional regulator [Oscillospiraceae bacterium]|nr:LysR family transcriptional regulator [Oscillospiraceae bacterium]
MDIDQLKYFITIAQTLNFSEAARRVGLAQPSISHHINELEKHLGCQLFVRSRRSVSLTEAGMKLLPYAVEIVDLAEKAAFQLNHFEQGKGGHITIAALTTSSRALSECLARFSVLYPDITVDINFTSGRTQMMEINEGKYDFYFTVEQMVPSGETYEYIRTHTDYLCLAMPKNHPMADKPLDFEALRDERFIAISESDGPTLYSCIRSVCAARGYTPKVTCQYDRAEAVLLSVGSGLGISIIPGAISRVFYSENVVFKRIEGDDAIRQYVLAWRSSTTNPAARLFIDVAREIFTKRKGDRDNA